MQDRIVEFVSYLRDKKNVSPATIGVHVAALKYFFEIKDFLGVNWEKICKFIGEFYSVVDDRSYTGEGIAKAPFFCPFIRDRAIILTLSSTGLRIGGLLKLQLKHLIEIPKYNIYQIVVYKDKEAIHNFLQSRN